MRPGEQAVFMSLFIAESVSGAQLARTGPTASKEHVNPMPPASITSGVVQPGRIGFAALQGFCLKERPYQSFHQGDFFVRLPLATSLFGKFNCNIRCASSRNCGKPNAS